MYFPNILARGSTVRIALSEFGAIAIKPEKKEDKSMFPTYTVKSAGPALVGTPFAYWYFLFLGDQKNPLQGFSNYYDAVDKKNQLTKDATERFARQLLLTEAMKDVAELDTKVVAKLVEERKEDDAEKAEFEAKSKTKPVNFFTKTFEDADFYV